MLDRIRTPSKAALALAAAATAATALASLVCDPRTRDAHQRHGDASRRGGDESAPDASRHGSDAAADTKYIHVKFESHAALVASLIYTSDAYQPLFTHLPVTADTRTDERTWWARLRVPASRVESVLAELRSDSRIQIAFEEPETTLAHADHGSAVRHADGDSCPVTTPSFESYQGYLGPAPHGIDAPAAWRAGHRGAGIWFADIEGGWNAAHEDLPGDRITHVAGQPIRDVMWRAHGTAVLGQVVGRDNGKGVVGIAPDVERVFTSSLGGIGVADAIDAAASKLRAGDVLLIELQSAGPRGRYIPVEYWEDVFDAIEAATTRGVIVVEAAGNGGEDLDHPRYEGAFDREKRDSGAIMVGAGGPPREGFADRERLDFSNYGARVDVQGWGRKVATLDYGDLQACNDATDRTYADRHYTGEFAGTSSASPIVAGAAIILQGIAKQRGKVLAPAELRDLLRRTGTPQAGDTKQAIGPRPDLARAIRALN